MERGLNGGGGVVDLRDIGQRGGEGRGADVAIGPDVFDAAAEEQDAEATRGKTRDTHANGRFVGGRLFESTVAPARRDGRNSSVSQQAEK